jgi:urease accessory protein
VSAPDLGRAVAVLRHGAEGAVDRVALGYDARLLRRKRLETVAGASVLVDLPETVSLDAGDALELEDGRRIAVEAAPEPLLRIEGDLPRLAWHIGNRHTPCAVHPDHLLIRDDHVLARMLQGLGARLSPVTGPFTPEGGAYGHGRTMGHDHGPTQGHAHAHDYGHGHGHGHGHDHSHDHDHGHDHPHPSHDPPHSHSHD